MRFVAALCAYDLALLGSLQAGMPAELPDVAMGWGLLLHVERATALVAGLGAVFLIAWRASRGDFPIRFGQIEYAVREAARDATAREQALQRRVSVLEDVVELRDSPRRDQ